MLTFSRSANPYIRGVKPRVFFEGRKRDLNKQIMLNEVSKDHYPKWDPSKYYINSRYDKLSPESKSFMEIAPWVLAILIAMVSLF